MELFTYNIFNLSYRAQDKSELYVISKLKKIDENPNR